MPEGRKNPKHRGKLVKDINHAFGRARIARTARRLRPLSASADFLDITNALGLLDDFTLGNLRRYKRELSIPAHIRRILTLAFRTALLHEPRRIPLRIAIVSGRSEAVQVSVRDRQISIVLTRPRLAAR